MSRCESGQEASGAAVIGLLKNYFSMPESWSVQTSVQRLAGITSELERLGCRDIAMRSGMRTGDTPAAERLRMRRSPPHILVITPESLYILLTSAGGRTGPRPPTR